MLLLIAVEDLSAAREPDLDDVRRLEGVLEHLGDGDGGTVFVAGHGYLLRAVRLSSDAFSNISSVPGVVI
jgi:hypothetical protein